MALFEGRRRRWGDRKDGYLVRNLDPMGKMIPYIMKKKTDAWVLFEERLDITKTQEWIRTLSKERFPGLSMYHLLFAGMVRAMSQIPQLNRFVVHNNVYARNEMKYAMVVKKGMNTTGDRTVILPYFQPQDTLKEVYESIQKEIDKIDRSVKVEEDVNKTKFDTLEFGLSILPHFVLRFMVGVLKFLDYRGWIPRKVTAASPFHTSCFFTNKGSFGMEAVHHHVYEFGTLSIFGALGKKESEYVTDQNGDKTKKTFVRLRFVVDERITGGFEYGAGFKILKNCLSHPEQLLQPPKQVVADVIDRERRRKKSPCVE